MSRKVLKKASHSLNESITNSNYFYEDIEFRVNETGQITNRNNEIEKDNDSNNYTIKKVPIFSGININNLHILLYIYFLLWQLYNELFRNSNYLLYILIL